MKKLNLILIVLGCCLGACSVTSDRKYVINGKVGTDISGELVLVSARKGGGWDTLQRIVPQDGQFYLEGNLACPKIAYLCYNDRRVQGKMPLMLEDTVFSVEIRKKDLSDFRNFDIVGGKWQRIRNEIYAVQRNDYKELDSVMNLIHQAEEAGNIASKMHHLWTVQAIGGIYDAHENEFIAANKDNMVGLSLVFSKLKYLSYEGLEKKLGLLADTMRNTVEGKLLQERLAVLQELEPGSLAPDFQVTTLNGDIISLKDLKGKVKILDFWASWCGPCRAANPHMKELYAKYKDKGVVMLSISMDTSKKAWEEAVKADGLDWLQACNLDGMSGEIGKKYRLRGIPSVFILGADNKILGRTTDYNEIVNLIEKTL